MINSLSVVLPAYNEEANIATAVERLLSILPGLAEKYEVIVVNDGSTDQTQSFAEGLVRQNEGLVRLLTQVANRGYGAALRSGFVAARYDYVFFTDSDNQFDVSELRYFLPQMEHYDLMTGFRVYRFDTVMRSMLSWIYNRIVRIIFGVRVRDVDCAFKLMRREVVDQITIECNNFFVSCELMAKAKKWNFRIGQKGVRHYPRTAGETSVRPSDIPRTLREMITMWQRIYFPSRRQKLRAAEHYSEPLLEYSPDRADA